MTDFTPDDLDRLAAGDGKPRPKGKLPYLEDELEVDGLRDWLGLAVRPPNGWQVHDFQRAGRGKTDPCTLTITNGRERETFRFDTQQILYTQPRVALHSVSDGRLRMPHLTGTEVEDFWAALTRLGHVLAEYDETHETTKWMEHLLEACEPLVGFTLVPDHRHDGLMALRQRGEFKRSHALTLVRPMEDTKRAHRPVRFVDRQTDDQWVRAGETLCYLRHVEGVEPLAGSTLRARLGEIGVTAKHFEDYRPPHPKALLYRLTDELKGATQ
jgi:hypothetical protein